MTSQPGHRVAVLLVDDEPDTLDLYAELLAHHDITTATSVSESRALLVSGYRPEVVLSDYGLGDGTGLDVLEEVRRLAPAARRIILTAAPERVPASALGGLAERIVSKLSPEATELLATI